MTLRTVLFWGAMLAGSALLNSGFLFKQSWCALAAGVLFAISISLG